jgi:hypothetical protein
MAAGSCPTPALGESCCICSRLSCSSAPMRGASPFLDTLRGYPWTGNVRQLRGLLQSTLLLWDGGVGRVAMEFSGPTTVRLQRAAARVDYDPQRWPQAVGGKPVRKDEPGRTRLDPSRSLGALQGPGSKSIELSPHLVKLAFHRCNAL